MVNNLVRVLMAHNYYQHPGGEDTQFHAERDLLRSKNHEVISWTVSNQELLNQPAVKNAGNSIWSINSAKEINKIIHQHKIDIAHFHNTFLKMSPSVYRTCNKAGIPVVQTIQNYRYLCPKATFYREDQICEICAAKHFAYPAVMYQCYRNSSLQSLVVSGMLFIHKMLKTWAKRVSVFVVMTEFMKSKFIEYGFPEEKIFVKPNFVYPDPGFPGFEKTTGNYALFVGRLTKEKGIDTLLSAWNYLDQIPLMIAGDGDEASKFRGIAASKKLNNITFLGWLDKTRIFDLMKNAAFLVFPSKWYEGLPLTIVEAYACGLPVIASNLGAMAEIVDHGNTGYHFKVGDPQDLAKHASKLWDDSKLRNQMSISARENFNRKYSAEVNYHLLKQIYTQAIKGL